MDVLGKDHEVPFGAAAIAVWESVWGTIEHFIAEVRAVLGSHLRDGGIAAFRLPRGGPRQVGALTIGRTRLRFECPLDGCPAAASEPALREVFGAHATLVRILVFRDSSSAPPRLESMLIAEPSSGRWIATEPEMGPASLRDVEALDRFLWSLLADRAD